MNLKYQTDCKGIDWNKVPELLEKGGMSTATPHVHRITFENSYSVIFVFDDERLIGFGRIISDGLRQSAIYDIVVDDEYQGLRLGREIVTRLMDATPYCNFILYASAGKEGFYEALGFKKMTTGMAFFDNPERMIDGVFVVP